MHEGPILGEQGCLDEFIVPLDRERLGFRVDQGLDESQKVFRIERRGRGGQPSGDIQMADDLDAIFCNDGLAGFRQFAVSATLDGKIDDNRAGAHRFDHGGRDKDRRRAAGNKGRRDDDILRGDMRSGERRLFRLIAGRHLLGISGRRLGLFEFLVLDGDEFGAKRHNLLFRRRPDVGRGHDGAELARGGDRLQPRDADAHDEDFRGGIMPAAVIIIGMTRPYSAAASMTAR